MIQKLYNYIYPHLLSLFERFPFFSTIFDDNSSISSSRSRALDHWKNLFTIQFGSKFLFQLPDRHIWHIMSQDSMGASKSSRFKISSMYKYILPHHILFEKKHDATKTNKQSTKKSLKHGAFKIEVIGNFFQPSISNCFFRLSTFLLGLWVAKIVKSSLVTFDES